MQRCLQLAALGLGTVQPNPMVGAVIVHHDKVIGEGWHRKYGEPHAEVNAINSVKNRELLKDSTIYVSLEPCSHFGKTPPCADLIIQNQIPKVVIAASDPNKKVNGKGIQKLKEANIEVVKDVLLEQSILLNKRFFTYQILHRPYIILKWAQTIDGYMDVERGSDTTPESYWITNRSLRVLAHKMRDEEQAILVGYNTFINDKPQLTNRLFGSHQPLRCVATSTPESMPEETQNLDFLFLNEEPNQIINALYDRKIQSVIIEGGRKTLEHFIAADLWDEAVVFEGNQSWKKGLKAPILNLEPSDIKEFIDNKVRYYHNPSSQIFNAYTQYFK